MRNREFPIRLARRPAATTETDTVVKVRDAWEADIPAGFVNGGTSLTTYVAELETGT